MFEQWDGDEDGLLSKDELMPLERNEREACVAQFIDMCDDMVVDGKISVDEWCDCFSFADDLRHEPPCHKQKHSVDPHKKEGYYRPEQCHNGFCWCVDRFGREFDNSRIKGELPDCAQYGMYIGY
uniref:Thyroglobulin type-1 domain-containing protein n=1 Tax=Angiostrongylus cantonensis TaxID=6313 RepID=A0A0K0CY34_ANGCA